jgi:hypothetical protein
MIKYSGVVFPPVTWAVELTVNRASTDEFGIPQVNCVVVEGTSFRKQNGVVYQLGHSDGCATCGGG